MNILRPIDKNCAYCHLKLGLVRWKTDDGKAVHKKCRALYHASKLVGHTLINDHRIRYTILDNGQPQIQCDACDKTKKMMCNAEDIPHYLAGDNWQQFGDTLLCDRCTQIVRETFYRN